MMEHDHDVGLLLDKLKELGFEDNTIVMYSTDNGAEKFSWPDGGTAPFRNEKASNWKVVTGCRVPSSGPVLSNQAPSSTTSSRTKTCYLRCSLRPACQT
jgi:hypothetical protein